jgi:hypothetical protein
MTQNNLGTALRTLGEREGGTGRLEEAVAAWNVCLTVAASVAAGMGTGSALAHR